MHNPPLTGYGRWPGRPGPGPGPCGWSCPVKEAPSLGPTAAACRGSLEPWGGRAGPGCPWWGPGPRGEAVRAPGRAWGCRRSCPGCWSCRARGRCSWRWKCLRSQTAGGSFLEGVMNVTGKGTSTVIARAALMALCLHSSALCICVYSVNVFYIFPHCHFFFVLLSFLSSIVPCVLFCFSIMCLFLTFIIGITLYGRVGVCACVCVCVCVLSVA